MRAQENRPAETRTPRALVRPHPRQLLNLSAAVAGTLGGVVLLASNVAILVAAQLATIPWVPLGANVALVFGGLMFAREYRRGREHRASQSNGAW